MTALSGALLGVAVLLAAGAATASDGPVRSEAKTEIDGRALSGGLILLGGAYAVALAIPVSEGFDRGRGVLAVPVAGPWIAIGSDADVGKWGMAFDGITQVSGALITGFAIAYPRRTLGPAKSQRPFVRVGWVYGSKELRVGTEF